MHVKLKDKDGKYIQDENGEDLILKNVIKPNANLDRYWSKLYGATAYEEVFIAIPDSVKLREIKKRRNRLLNETDWTQLGDAPLTDAKKKKWKEYRAALRDLTKNLDLDNPAWPTDPNGNR